jgi:hypothetical protein
MLTEIFGKMRARSSIEQHFIFNHISETILINTKINRPGIIGYILPYKSVEYELPMAICSVFDNINTKCWVLISENMRMNFHLI